MGEKAPFAPETQKAMALQKSIRRHLSFVWEVKKIASREGLTLDELLSDDRVRDTVYQILGLDHQKIKEENAAILSFLMEAAGNNPTFKETP